MKIQNKNKPELMAPVGSFEALQAAIQGGADSVYFGAGHLNMRSKSTFNFTTDDLKEIVSICHDKGVKAYMTLNTIIYDAEVDAMKDYAAAALEAGVDAVIASDLAVISHCKSIGLRIHASTQLNVSNIEAVKFFANFTDVIVLARELTLQQTAEIIRQIEAEQVKGPSGELMKIEIFCHGALCVSISGKCYLSLHEYNQSANRGACVQLCRRKYIAKEKDSDYELEIENEYIMSPKDLKTIHFLNKIIDAGVQVLKIEGRGRSPEYVKTVTKCYREAIDAHAEGTFNAKKIEDWNSRLSTVFNRGFWDGYYLGQKLGAWTDKYGNRATKKKVYLGITKNYYSNLGVASFLVENGELNTGDNIVVTGSTTGVYEDTITEMRIADKVVTTAKKGEEFSIPVSSLIRRQDKIYKLIDVVREKRFE